MQNLNELNSLFGRLPNAVAFINGSDKFPQINGMILFYGGVGGVMVCSEITGLPKSDNQCQKPIFAYHIHSGNTCSGNETDPFSMSGGHLNNYNCPHPYHQGDMPPLFGVNGKAFSIFLTDRFTIPEILGRTVIIHSMPDDFKTQPSGNAGEKIACGVITPIAR